VRKTIIGFVLVKLQGMEMLQIGSGREQAGFLSKR